MQTTSSLKRRRPPSNRRVLRSLYLHERYHCFARRTLPELEPRTFGIRERPETDRNSFWTSQPSSLRLNSSPGQCLAIRRRAPTQNNPAVLPKPSRAPADHFGALNGQQGVEKNTQFMRYADDGSHLLLPCLKHAVINFSDDPFRNRASG